MQPVFGVKASPLVILCVYPTLTISLVGVSKFVVHVMEMMREHPELLGESFNFFPRLYHTYHFPFRPFFVRAPVRQPPSPSQVPRLTGLPDPERDVFLSLHRHG